jgi:hypothetical protein
MAARYLEQNVDIEWLLVLDADTGVVNPLKCIDEYYSKSDQIVFYERFFNWEIMSGNYLVKNVEWSRQFLLGWANYDVKATNIPWSSYDNGALQSHLLYSIINEQQIRSKIDVCHQLWLNSDQGVRLVHFELCL